MDGFHLLLSTQLTADLTLKWSGGSMFHPLSHIYAKTLSRSVETAANNALNHQCVVFFDWLWANAATTLKTAFSLINVHQNGEYTAFWYLQLLCYRMQYQFMIGQNKFVEFFGVFWDNCWIWATWAFNIICVCTTAFKVSIPPLNCCFWWSRVWITLIKQSNGLNSIFSRQNRKQCFINTWNSDFSIVLNICNSKSKVGNHSRRWPEGSLFNSYHNEVLGGVLIPWIAPLYPWSLPYNSEG